MEILKYKIDMNCKFKLVYEVYMAKYNRNCEIISTDKPMLN
jgi:hypothetical protein